MLQDRAFRPKVDAQCECITIEKLVNQRKALETKRQMLKYETAELINRKKPAILPVLPDREDETLGSQWRTCA